MGLLYVGNYNLYDPSHGGARTGRPPSGLYLASKPVRLTGRLLRRYRYQVSSPVPNGLFSVQLMPGTTTLVVIPGHGSICGADQAHTRIDQDRAYLHALRDASDPRVGPAAAYDWVPGVHERQVQPLAQKRERDGTPG